MEEWKNENSSRIESKRSHEWLGDDTEVEPCTKEQAKNALRDIELESCANNGLNLGCYYRRSLAKLPDGDRGCAVGCKWNAMAESVGLMVDCWKEAACKSWVESGLLCITFVLDEEMSGDDECRETLQGITNNGKLSEGYLMLARDIEVMEPKSSKDIYKIRSKFSRVLEDKKMPLDVIVFTAISLGLVYVGSYDEDVSQTIIYALKHRNVSKLGQPLTCLLLLGLDLLYLGKQKSVEATAEISKTLNTKIRTHCDMILFSCAYAGTGDVLKVFTLRLSIRIGVRSVMLMKVADRSFFTQVQYLLGQCAQHLKRGKTHQGPTVLGIAMVATAEELGLEMVIRC
ncbi:hypothetical protein LOK49_LG10G01063 [Camellia lanceoleosa]|uniref:Uncharacterized protein n=1 Tax=Camellia lanceoleosa TaxID=1840588 RepID=A0ACC0GHX6_9ERIC|nr:hypothetical protein LOK49_LG10G01063 [Camellia lanceoleosa]